MKRAVLILSLISFWIALPSFVQASPTLAPGTVVIYSDGRVEKLLGTKGERTIWETGRKRVYERAPIGFYENRREERYPIGARTTIWSANDAELEQLVAAGPGNELDFIAYRERDGVTKQRIWTCAYLRDTEERVGNVTTTAQHFSCERYSEYRYHLRVRDQREIKYAPDLGVVIWEKRSRPNAEPRERQVVEILPPERATMSTISDAVKQLR